MGMLHVFNVKRDMNFKSIKFNLLNISGTGCMETKFSMIPS